MERAVDWQELSVSSRGMSSASCYSFNLCRRDKELLFDSECFADGERLKFYEVPVTAEELTPLAKQVHEQKRDAGHEKMHPMRGFRLFRELPEK